MFRLYTSRIPLVVTVLFMLAISSYAEVPNYINYQGRLTDNGGQPVNGTKFVKFKIYGSLSGDDSLWSSGLQIVTITDGLFNYELGSNVNLPDDLFAGSDLRYLGVTVDTDAEISPRTQLITVPYAHHAAIADSAKATAPSPDNDWNINGNDIYHENGNVGIWNDAPSAPLVVGDDLGPVSGKHVVIGDNDVGAYPGLIIGRSNDNYGWLSYMVDDDYITIGSKERGLIYSNAIVAKSGNVGIGVTEPQERLVVGANLGDFGGSRICVGDNTPGTETGIVLGEDNSNRGWLLWNIDNDYLGIGTRESGSTFGSTMTFKGGDIGIGVLPADTAKLSVKSTVSPLAGTHHTGIDSRIVATNSNGYNHGGYFRAEGGYEAIGIQCRALNGSSYSAAGEFFSDWVGIYVVGSPFAAILSGTVAITGNLSVSGSVSKSGGSFKIDHPLDPENRYLQHSFVESPDMMNIYNGNIVTDAKGFAEVVMPDYFEALNMDFRYQLTVIGEFAQAIIGEKISNGRFTIRTDKPNVEVSWQVTGIRQDRWANEHRIEVEVDKPEDEQGYFIAPELYGFGKEKGIDYKLHGHLRDKQGSDK